MKMKELKRNIEYAALLLETAHSEGPQKYEEVAASEKESTSTIEVAEGISPEVRQWLTTTFARRQAEPEKKSYKSVANAVRMGIKFDKLLAKSVQVKPIPIPDAYTDSLKDLDKWEFNVFDFHELTNGHVLLHVGIQLFNVYRFHATYKIPSKTVIAFLGQLEAGYGKHGNPYHNAIHAADVAQTAHALFARTELTVIGRTKRSHVELKLNFRQQKHKYTSELELFATIFAALIHDYEHTGQTNNFHIESRSELANTYNDQHVLESHHASAVFRFMAAQPAANILATLTREDYTVFRKLVVDIVLATDMSTHMDQITGLKTQISAGNEHCWLWFSIFPEKACPLPIGRIKVTWLQVVEEFYLQGDQEHSLGLPYSPLCDRLSTNIPISQIGFIDFIVEPTLMVCHELLLQIVPVASSYSDDSRRLPETEPFANAMDQPPEEYLRFNREEWRQQSKNVEKSSAAARESFTKQFESFDSHDQDGD